MGEKWKDISGYEGLYKVSNYGDILSLTKNVIMKPFDNGGYHRIQLYKNGDAEKFLVHRLVIEHFGEIKPSENAQVNHKDLNKINNHISNLEWCTPSENVNHAVENIDGRRNFLQEKMSSIGKEYGKLGVEASKKPVAQIDLVTGHVICVFESARDADRLTGTKYKSISQVCNGQRKSCNGYGWKFV